MLFFLYTGRPTVPPLPGYTGAVEKKITCVAGLDPCWLLFSTGFLRFLFVFVFGEGDRPSPSWLYGGGRETYRTRDVRCRVGPVVSVFLAGFHRFSIGFCIRGGRQSLPAQVRRAISHTVRVLPGWTRAECFFLVGFHRFFICFCSLGEGDNPPPPEGFHMFSFAFFVLTIGGVKSEIVLGGDFFLPFE